MIVSLGVLATSLSFGNGGLPQATSQAATTTVTLPGSVVKMAFAPIAGGKTTIGGKEVEVAPFSIATTETVWEAFDVFLASGPPSKPYDQTVFAPDAVARPSKSYILPDLGWGHRGFPVINVSHTSAEMFCRWLSSATGKKFRLPTEAEWEFACRGGLPAKLDAAFLDRHSWHAGNSEETTHAVAKKAPNAYGLFDMLGNAGEWAADLQGKPVLCGPTFKHPAAEVAPTVRQYYSPKWQETDPQIPKSRWWYSDGPMAGFRVVLEG